jgi:hypothetical protein
VRWWTHVKYLVLVDYLSLSRTTGSNTTLMSAPSSSRQAGPSNSGSVSELVPKLQQLGHEDEDVEGEGSDSEDEVADEGGAGGAGGEDGGKKKKKKKKKKSKAKAPEK